MWGKERSELCAEKPGMDFTVHGEPLKEIKWGRNTAALFFLVVHLFLIQSW